MKNKSGAGFTLIEVLVYVAVLAIIVLAVSSFFLWAVRSNTKTRVMRETLYNAERAMMVMIQEIKEAESIYTPTSLFDVHPGQLSLETIKYLPEGEETSFVDFYLSNGQLYFKKETSDDPIALTSDKVKVSNLVFTQIATTPTAPSIQINLKVDYQTQAERPEYQASINLTSTASLRSY